MPTSPSSSPPPSTLSLEEVRLIARLLHEADLSEIEIETLAPDPKALDGAPAPDSTPHSTPRVRLQMRRGTDPSLPRRVVAPAVSKAAALPPAAIPVIGEDAGAFEVRSRGVGVFRELDPPLAVGDEVWAGQKAGAVEALKIPTDLVFKHAGRITQVLAEDGTGVEYDQLLFLIQTLD